MRIKTELAKLKSIDLYAFMLFAFTLPLLTNGMVTSGSFPLFGIKVILNVYDLLLLL